jgi:hypothetical protein
MLHFLLYHSMTSTEQTDDTTALRQLIRELSHVNSAVKISAIYRTILWQEKAPRSQLLQALKDPRADVTPFADRYVK